MSKSFFKRFLPEKVPSTYKDFISGGLLQQSKGINHYPSSSTTDNNTKTNTDTSISLPNNNNNSLKRIGKSSPVIQQIYVLPTLNQHYVFTARYLKPNSSLERAQLILAYMSRKYRYFISDIFGSQWHAFGIWASSTPTATSPSYPTATTTSTPNSTASYNNSSKKLFHLIYRLGNKLTTRKTDHEYFLRAIHLRSEGIQIVYPQGENLEKIKSQLSRWLEELPSEKNQMMLWGIMMPINLFTSKILPHEFGLPWSILFTYSCFRFNIHFRTWRGSLHLSQLLARNKVVWHESKELKDYLVEQSNVNGEKLLKEQHELAVRHHGSESSHGDIAFELEKKKFEWRNGLDIHDDVVTQLEKDGRLLELGRNYKRSRMQQFLIGK